MEVDGSDPPFLPPGAGAGVLRDSHLRNTPWGGRSRRIDPCGKAPAKISEDLLRSSKEFIPPTRHLSRKLYLRKHHRFGVGGSLQARRGLLEFVLPGQNRKAPREPGLLLYRVAGGGFPREAEIILAKAILICYGSFSAAEVAPPCEPQKVTENPMGRLCCGVSVVLSAVRFVSAAWTTRGVDSIQPFQ